MAVCTGVGDRVEVDTEVGNLVAVLEGVLVPVTVDVCVETCVGTDSFVEVGDSVAVCEAVDVAECV